MNALWFLSLVISLTCALLATLLQQWARRYLKITQSRYSPHKRARIRAFFAEGVEKCLLPWAVEILPTLLHISLFLFFAGLVVFLCSVNLTIFKLVLSWVGLCTALYGCITCMPIFRHDSPYSTPLSLPAWHIVTGTLYLVHQFLRWFNESVLHRYDFQYSNLQRYRTSLEWGMQKMAEETALNSPPEIDARAFMWTFDCLDEDHELERFFAGLPGIRSSKVVKDPLPSLTGWDKWKLQCALEGLLDRTFSSDLLSTPVKNRRAMICAKAIDPEPMTRAISTLNMILIKYQYSGPLATEIAKIIRSWGNNMDECDIWYARFVIFQVIATKQPCDDSWYNLASNELGFPETSLRNYATHGDDLSLFILIHFLRQHFMHFQDSWVECDFSSALSKASKFDIKDTSLELQHEFCALWNQIVNDVQDSADWDRAFHILGPIRNVFLALHQDTDSAPTRFSASTGDYDRILRHPSSYPVCTVLDHRSDSTPHMYDDGVSTTLACATPHHHPNYAFVPSIASPDLPPSSTHTQIPVDETLANTLPLDNRIFVQGSSKPIVQTTTESRRLTTTPLSPVTACTTHRIIDHSSRTMYLSASDPSTSDPPFKSNASASPSDNIAVVRTELSRAPSDDLHVRSSPSPSMPVLDAGLLLLFLGRDSI